MKTTSRIATALLALMLVLSLASCAAGNEAMNQAISKGDGYYAESDQGTTTGATGSKPSSAGSVNVGEAADAAGGAEFASKIIRNVQMDTETKEYDRAIAELDRLVTECGGFIESSSTNGQSLSYSDVYRRSAKYVIRIPAEQLTSFLSSTEALLNVTYSHSTSQNVTPQYYDIQARLEVLRTEREALDGMLQKAVNVDEMLSIRDRLYNVIEEIESAETQLRVYDSLVSYSTVTMSVDEVVEYTEIVVEEPTWGKRLGDAFRESWQDFADNFQDFTVGLLYAIPTLLTLGVIGGAVAVILILVTRRGRAARAARRAQWQAPHPQNDRNNQNNQNK